MYNTPPCFGIYTIDLVLKWIEDIVGECGLNLLINNAGLTQGFPPKDDTPELMRKMFEV